MATKQPKPGVNKPGTAKTAKSSPRGRTTPKGTASRVGKPSTAIESGRYTPPVPKAVRRSPRWFGLTLLAFMLGGVVMILLNYLNALPGATSGWYLIGGLAMIFVGFIGATRYH